MQVFFGYNFKKKSSSVTPSKIQLHTCSISSVIHGLCLFVKCIFNDFALYFNVVRERDNITARNYVTN